MRRVTFTVSPSLPMPSPSVPDDYQRALRAHGIACSFSGRGNCWDSCRRALLRNAEARARPPPHLAHTPRGAEAIHEYIEVFYNRRRHHTTLGGKAPAVFEALAERQVAQAA